MRFALLGIDDATRRLAQAATDAGHELAAVADATAADVANHRDGLHGVAILDDWQRLLEGATCDAVIVAAGPEDRRLDQLRVLIQAAVPLLVSHPVVDSMLAYFELDMYRQGSGSVLMPVAPERWHPAIVRLVELAAAGERSPIGVAEQLIIERPLVERSRAHVRSALVADLAVIRALAGPMERVGAMSSLSATRAVDWANLNLQAGGPSGVLVRWSTGPVEDRAPQITLVGKQGKAVVSMPDHQPWTLQLRTAAETRTETYDAPDLAAETLERFEAALAGAPCEPSWLDVCRDMEVVDAVERSASRGRTIEVHGEEQTEQGAFKGVMAAGGCLLLVAALLIVLLGTTAVWLNVVGAHLWPYALLGVLGVFLLLQLLHLTWPRKQVSQMNHGVKDRNRAS